MQRPKPDDPRREELAQLLDRGFRYATALTGDPVLAEDVLQDAWTSVLSTRNPSNLHVGYLFRAIRSRFIDHVRRVRRIHFEPTEEVVVSVGPEAERLIEADALWAGLLTLGAREREALYLHHVEGFTAREIAERTDSPRNTVLTVLRRGRKRLQAWLEHRGLEATG